MNFLDKINANHKDMIVRLPYRVGLWVSRSDVSGGPESEAHELQALSNIIHGFSEEVFGSETIQYIMHETIKRKNEWERWGDGLERVPDDCRKAIDVMREFADEKDANAFKVRLLEIGEAVALAFREDDVDKPVSKFSALGRYAIYKLTAKGKNKAQSFEEFLNVSAGERKALEAISDALEAA